MWRDNHPPSPLPFIQRHSTWKYFGKPAIPLYLCRHSFWTLKLFYQKPGERSCKATGSRFKEIRGRHESCCLAWGPAYGFGKEVFAMDGSHSAVPLKPPELLDVNMKVVAGKQLGPSEGWGQHVRWISTCAGHFHCLSLPRRVNSLLAIGNAHTWGWDTWPLASESGRKVRHCYLEALAWAPGTQPERAAEVNGQTYCLSDTFLGLRHACWHSLPSVLKEGVIILSVQMSTARPTSLQSSLQSTR